MTFCPAPQIDPDVELEMHRDIAAYWSTHPDYLPEWAPTEEGSQA